MKGSRGECSLRFCQLCTIAWLILSTMSLVHQEFRYITTVSVGRDLGRKGDNLLSTLAFAGFKKSRFQDSTEEVLQPEVLPCAFFAATAAGRGRSRNGCMHVLVMTQLGMGTCRPGVP